MTSRPTDAASLLERARRDGTPLIDGDQATFVWQGGRGEQPPLLAADFNRWGMGGSAFDQLIEAEPGVWAHTVQLPRDAYIEYAYLRDGERIDDPFNRRLITNGMEEFNYFFEMPDTAWTDLIELKRNVPRGEITRHTLEQSYMLIGGKRTVYLYQPPVSEPVPLLVVYDGQDYLKRGRLKTIVENLIHQRRIRPVALALIEHGRQARFVEYACSEATVALVLSHLLPLARQHLNLIEPTGDPGTPGAYGVLGASMSGLMALYTALRAPQVFGNVLSQSGAFLPDPHAALLQEMLKHFPPHPINIWMDVGRYEFLHDHNTRMQALLDEHGYHAALRVYHGGHNYTAWRNDVWHGLEYLYGL